MTAPGISFVVITSGRPQRLLRAVESIRRQRSNSYEIVVVVNGPDSKTEEVLRRLGSEIRVVILPENRGVGAGRNIGIASSLGGVLFFLDDDAELRDPDTAERVLRHFERNSSLAVVSLLVIDGRTGQVEARCLPFQHKRLPEKVTTACYFAGGAAAIRRAVFDRIGVFDESLFYSCEELDLYYRILAHDFRIIFDPTIAITHYSVRKNFDYTRVYFDARNRTWIALRHLPLLYCVSHCLLWWGRSVGIGIRRGGMGDALRGIRDCIAGIPALYLERKPIGRCTRRVLAHNNGRLWY
jgi:GT2 family glycosyltransferase